MLINFNIWARLCKPYTAGVRFVGRRALYPRLEPRGARVWECGRTAAVCRGLIRRGGLLDAGVSWKRVSLCVCSWATEYYVY